MGNWHLSLSLTASVIHRMANAYDMQKKLVLNDKNASYPLASGTALTIERDQR